jgi:hypothetical protein
MHVCNALYSGIYSTDACRQQPVWIVLQGEFMEKCPLHLVSAVELNAQHCTATLFACLQKYLYSRSQLFSPGRNAGSVKCAVAVIHNGLLIGFHAIYYCSSFPCASSGAAKGLGGCGLDSTLSGQGPVAGCCECGDESSGSCAMELVS